MVSCLLAGWGGSLWTLCCEGVKAGTAVAILPPRGRWLRVKLMLQPGMERRGEELGFSYDVNGLLS